MGAGRTCFLSGGSGVARCTGRGAAHPGGASMRCWWGNGYKDLARSLGFAREIHHTSAQQRTLLWEALGLHLLTLSMEVN